MTNKLTLLVALPVVAGLVTACGGGSSRSSVPSPSFTAPPKINLPPKLTPPPKITLPSVPVPIYVPPSTLGGYYDDVPGGVLESTRTAAGPLLHSKYGLFIQDTASTASVGGYYKSKLTPLSQMPRDVSGTYKGSFAGFDGVKPGQRQRINGDAHLRANFSAGTINGNVSNLKNTNGVTKPYGLSMKGQISGNTYKGTSRFTTKSGAPAGTVTSSDLKGVFAGSNARETVGYMHVVGTPGAGQPIKSVVGAFGAKKQ